MLYKESFWHFRNEIMLQAVEENNKRKPAEDAVSEKQFYA